MKSTEKRRNSQETDFRFKWPYYQVPGICLFILHVLRTGKRKDQFYASGPDYISTLRILRWWRCWREGMSLPKYECRAVLTCSLFPARMYNDPTRRRKGEITLQLSWASLYGPNWWRIAASISHPSFLASVLRFFLPGLSRLDRDGKGGGERGEREERFVQLMCAANLRALLMMITRSLVGHAYPRVCPARRGCLSILLLYVCVCVVYYHVSYCTICMGSLAGCIGNELFCRHTVHREGKRMVWDMAIFGVWCVSLSIGSCMCWGAALIGFSLKR